MERAFWLVLGLMMLNKLKSLRFGQEQARRMKKSELGQCENENRSREKGEEGCRIGEEKRREKCVSCFLLTHFVIGWFLLVDMKENLNFLKLQLLGGPPLATKRVGVANFQLHILGYSTDIYITRLCQ